MKEGRERIIQILKDLKLELEPEKTREVNLGMGKGGFDFLGHHLRKCRSVKYPRYYFLNRWPSQRSMAKVRGEIERITSYRRMNIRDAYELVPELNRLLRGWSGYFKSGNAARKFSQIERYVWQRLVIFQNRRRGRKRPHFKRDYTYEWYRNLGLYRLLGRIGYPNPAYSKA